MNVFNFTGNLGQTAVQRFLPNGDSIVNFSVAVKSGYGDKAVTTWANCSMWGKRGEAVLQYLNKGQLVGISGELTLREYDKKDGGKASSLDVRVNDLTLLGKSESAKTESAESFNSRIEKHVPATGAAPSTQGNFNDFEDDIPFATNTIHDGAGQSKSLMRTKRGNKVSSLALANRSEF